LSEELIDTGTGSDIASGGQWCTGEKVSGLGAMDVSFEGFGVVEAFDEQDGVAHFVERCEDATEFQFTLFFFGPPFPAVEAVACEQDSQSHGSL
jgi:hypothetical protein